ncbi:hypothetical protein LP420_29860 [Massilia sp. B-10]|nr:hypothetical protein LP420_29860 [Massilia sp. B-10]
MTDESGQTTFKFDDFGNLIEKRQTTGTVTLTTKYSYAFEGNGAYRVASIVYPSGNQISYGYDASGNIASMSLNPGRAGGVTDLTVTVPILSNVQYDASGAVKGWNWGNHSVTKPSRNDRSYDLDGRMRSYSLGNTAALPTDVTTFLKVEASAMTFNATTKISSGSLKLTNSSSSAIAYPIEIHFKGLPSNLTLMSLTGSRDGVPYLLTGAIAPGAQVNLLLQFQNPSNVAVGYQSQAFSLAATGMTRTLEYDDASRIKSMTHAGGTATTQTNQRFDYDDLDRLISFAGNGNAQSYDYDESGNRSKLVIGANTYTVATSPLSNKLSGTTGPYPGKSSVTYGAGYILSDGTTFYTYSDRGRMKRAAKAGATTDYLYNAIDQRVVKSGVSVASGANFYAYDEAGQLLGEYSNNGAAVQETVYLGTTPVAVLRGDVYYVYADHLDTTQGDHDEFRQFASMALGHCGSIWCTASVGKSKW